jgi:hypothetical protein
VGRGEKPHKAEGASQELNSKTVRWTVFEEETPCKLGRLLIFGLLLQVRAAICCPFLIKKLKKFTALVDILKKLCYNTNIIYAFRGEFL